MRWRSLPTLIQRITVLALILGTEALTASIFLDGANLPREGFLVGLLHDWGAWTVRWMIGFIALFTTFAWLKYKNALAGISSDAESTRVRPLLLVAHASAIFVFAAVSEILYRRGGTYFAADAVVVVWALAGASAAVCLTLAVLPPGIWAMLVRRTGGLWMFAAAASLLACSAGIFSQRLWRFAAQSTFVLVKAMVTTMVADPVVQPAALRIGTHRFTVVIARECSGLEGMALLLVFGALWLTLFRHECRFPQALLLLPAGVIVLFLLNSGRIAALILIGHSGARQVAVGGFHSQAGWMAFNSVALGFCVVARRVQWFSNRPVERKQPREIDYSTSAYLIPFLAILAAGMISRATSGGFEWLYGLRLAAGVAALWVFRRSYADIAWRVSWFAPLAGALVFGIWMGLDVVLGPYADRATPAALAAAPTVSRILWIVLRAATAVLAVPIAEELAFRGFLYRRLIDERFETVPFRTFSWLALILSSLIFGVLHGQRWIAGTASGAVYAMVLLRRGRLADAIAAHVTTNALIAVWVLGFQRWDLW